ncbi:site-specific DNA-methyltransferase [Candidatus Woesearchaeota archaeon]|nr:site-specific DNA-methyltransferase [Candidatus Woesearchaeota archaeon]
MAERMNNLEGKSWLQNSFSIWRDIGKTNGEKKLKHPAMFPTQLTSRLIEIYTKNKGEVVLDPFLGSGSTIVSAYKLGKKGIGFELSKEYIKLSQNRIKDTQLDLTQKKEDLIKPEIYNKTVFDIPNILPENSVDLIITSPPYWDILTAKRSADRKEIRKYSDSKEDLGNIPDYGIFLDRLKKAFAGVYKVLKKGKYCIIVVMDIRKKSKFYPFHMDLVNKMQETGFELDDIVIWDRQKEYNNMRPLGYPYVFRVNKVHEFILIFKK